MAYEVRASSGVLIKPSPGKYPLAHPVVKSNKLALANEFTKDRDSGKRKPPLTADRNPRGSRGGRSSTSNALRLQTKNNGRTIVPST